MKLKNLPALLGLRTRPRNYGHTIKTYQLPVDGEVRFAQWNHPKSPVAELNAEALAELRRYVSPGAAVIDIGAHTGDTTVLYALAAGNGGRVFAVEPNHHVRTVLERNAGLNPQAAPIEILPFAATAETCRLTFQYSDPGYNNGGDLKYFNRLKHGHFYPLEVEGRNLLTELRKSFAQWLDRICLIKTDTEGNDHAVLLTLKDLLLKTRPYLLCEVYKQTGIEQRLGFYRFLVHELGYACHLAEPYQRLQGELLHEDTLTQRAHFDIFCVPK